MNYIEMEGDIQAVLAIDIKITEGQNWSRIQSNMTKGTLWHMMIAVRHKWLFLRTPGSQGPK